MSRIQLSRARRRVRRVKTASHCREEASTGHKRCEGTAEPTDFDAHHGQAHHRVWNRDRGDEFDQTDQVVAGNEKVY